MKKRKTTYAIVLQLLEELPDTEAEDLLRELAGLYDLKSFAFTGRD